MTLAAGLNGIAGGKPWVGWVGTGAMLAAAVADIVTQKQLARREPEPSVARELAEIYKRAADEAAGKVTAASSAATSQSNPTVVVVNDNSKEKLTAVEANLQQILAKYGLEIHPKEEQRKNQSPDRPPNPTSRYLTEEGVPPETDCFNCATGHLAAMSGALRHAAERAEQVGRCDDTCQQWVALAVKEPQALFSQDWTPDRYQRETEQGKAIIDKYSPRIRDVVNTLLPNEQARDIAEAAGLLNETIRFTSAGDPLDHPEVERRIAEAEQKLATAERSTIWPDDVAQEIRKVRRDVGSYINEPGDVPRVATEADRLLMDAGKQSWDKLSPSELRRLADEAESMRREFREDRRKVAV